MLLCNGNGVAMKLLRCFWRVFSMLLVLMVAIVFCSDVYVLLCGCYGSFVAAKVVLVIARMLLYGCLYVTSKGAQGLPRLI